MATMSHETPTKTPSDIENMQNSMQISGEISTQEERELRRSIMNLASILFLLETELHYEQDDEICILLSKQKDFIQKLLTQKQTDKKSSFEITENEAISQLQNQITNLKKSVDTKFDTILKFIENDQTAVKTYAQIVSQNTQSTNKQKEKLQTKSKEVTKSDTKQTILAAKQQAVSDYKKKRLIIHVKQQM